MLIKFEHLTCSLSLRIHDSVIAALGSVGQPTFTVLLFIEACFPGTFYFVTKCHIWGCSNAKSVSFSVLQVNSWQALRLQDRCLFDHFIVPLDGLNIGTSMLLKWGYQCRKYEKYKSHQLEHCLRKQYWEQNLISAGLWLYSLSFAVWWQSLESALSQESS